MSETPFIPRFAESSVVEALADTPVLLLHGPRQCGKTTLAQAVGKKFGYGYFSLDDEITFAAAQADPVGFVDDLPDRVILDEVQRTPAIFSTIKVSVDRRRHAGRFLLTGSANALLLPKLADSLAGRMGILRLHPLAQCELAGRRPRFLETLFAGSFKIRRAERLGRALAERLVAGGYPAALARSNPQRRAGWYRDYMVTLVQRDVRDLLRIASIDAISRLLALAAGQTARLVNVSELARPFQLSRPTIRGYLSLLEQIFLVEEVPPWHSNHLSRLVKTPKLHVTDTGLACALLGFNAEALRQERGIYGQMLETFVMQELKRQASWYSEEVRFYHFRDKDGGEVDIVLEQQGGRISGVEVKAAASVTAADFRGLNKLRLAAGKRFASGVVLHDGEICAGFGDGLYAVPIRMLWES